MNFTKTEAKECYTSRDIQRWEWIEEGPRYGTEEYKQSSEKMLRLCGEEGIVGAMDEKRLDLIVHPTNVDPPSTFTAMLGLPAITVPLGFYPDGTIPIRHRGDLIDVAPNVPFGITFAGRAYTEEILFRVAYVYETNSHIREKVQHYKLPRTELHDVVEG
ncbi:hypothetical protein QM012_003389 [Aureobasidium pullulans]|uniref:Amidase domain-containing protein n=1 Tax=Aureobasidium pullulans TaxID=5580 RepID=A0ABR0T8A1_AURPU